MANANITPGLPQSKYLCLTILGYRKSGMSEEAYRHHMNHVSAPMTKDLMVKYGVKRWTVVQNLLSLRHQLDMQEDLFLLDSQSLRDARAYESNIRSSNV